MFKDESIRRILVVFPQWLGDAVMTEPLLRSLRIQYPQAMIDGLASRYLVPLLKILPTLHQVWAHDFQHGAIEFRKYFLLARHLRIYDYQQAYIIPNSWKQAWVPYLAGIPKRIGWLGEYRWGLLTHPFYSPQRYQRMVDRILALSSCEKLKEGDRYPQWPQLIPQQTDHLVICPGAAFGSSKQWPAKHYVTVMKHYAELGYKLTLLGAQKDRSIADAILSGLPPDFCHDQVGRGDLFHAYQILATATLVLTHDSGLMHLAAALDKPLVALYGSSSPVFTPPLHPRKRSAILQTQLICQPCFQRICPLQHHACMQGLSPDKVIEALERLCH